MQVSSGNTGDVTLRTAASAQNTLVYFLNISNDGTGAGTAGHLIIEDGNGTDIVRVPFASTQHQHLFISFPEPLPVGPGLIINVVTATKVIFDVGWDG